MTTKKSIAELADKVTEMKALMAKVDSEKLKKDLSFHLEAMLAHCFNHLIAPHRKDKIEPTPSKTKKEGIPSLADSAVRGHNKDKPVF